MTATATPPTTPVTHLSAHELDAKSALGLLLHAAIKHLRDAGLCCTTCCERCTALRFYRDELPLIVDVAVRAGQTGEPDEWMLPTGDVNWPYLNQFWTAEGVHAPRCHLTQPTRDRLD